MKTMLLGLAAAVALIGGSAIAQTGCGDQGMWSNPLTIPGPIDAPFLLTDGRVMVQYVGNSSDPSCMDGGMHDRWQDWYALTPDSQGNYANGTWSQLKSLNGLWSPEYGPYGYAAAVLLSGKLLIQGGEVNCGAAQQFTNMGAIYDPSANLWTQLQPPGYQTGAPWPYIGDAPSVVLPNGNYMVAACNGAQFMGGQFTDCPDINQHLTYKDQAILTDPVNQYWQIVASPGNDKLDANSEEGWTLLPGPGPNGKVLTIDLAPPSPTVYEIFETTANTWSNFQGLSNDPLTGDYPSAGEIGPAIVTPDGNVFATGAANSKGLATNPARSGKSAIYNPSSGWTAGPIFPAISVSVFTGMGDEMAVLLPDGSVLMSAHDTQRIGNYYFLEFQYNNPQSFCPVTAPSGLIQNSFSSANKMLVLPTGQVLITHFDTTNPSSAIAYIYSPGGTFNTNWRPAITMFPSTIYAGSRNNFIQGIRFNGLSQANMFGDDFQNATNYPLVRITDGNGHVVYATTHDHSTMAIATGTNKVSTEFDVPSTIGTGSGTLVVVANGIASQPVSVTIAPQQ